MSNRFDVISEGLALRNGMTLFVVGLALLLVAGLVYERVKKQQAGDLSWYYVGGFYASLAIFAAFAFSIH